MLNVDSAGLGAASYIIMSSDIEGLVAELEPKSVVQIYQLGTIMSD